MSTNFTGITFPWQKVAPSDDAIIRRAILPDGILTGCEISYSGSTLTMAAGQLLICGRQVRHPSSQNWAVVDATSGYARLLLTIDVTRTSTKDVFDQVLDAIEYASSIDGFPDLEQADINGSGTRYQVAACVVSLGAGGITGIESQLKKSAVDGAGLNFKVVGGVTQPTDPAENTIWVNTDTPITSWVFSAIEPEEPVEGMVWIAVGTSSALEFNALKKNAIMIYPLFTKQYISGAWAKVMAKNFRGGEWVDFFFSEILYSRNVFNTEYAFELTPSTAPATLDDSCITLQTVASKASEVYIRFGPYDLTPVSTIKMVCTLASASSAAGDVNGVVFASLETGASYAGAVAIATQSISTSGNKESEQYEVTLDVSDLTGEYYLYCGTHTNGGNWANARTFKLYELGCYA